MTIALQLTHIIIDEKGVAWIEGTRMKVLHLIASKQSYGWSPEEMKRQFPHLSLAQIHAALTYYYENQQQVDLQIAEAKRKCEDLSRQTGPQPFKRQS